MQTKQLSLFITIIIWATLIGGVTYSHIVFFPPYLSHLPESNNLITGSYGLKERNFWMAIHPAVILSTIITLIFNWRQKERFRFIIIAGIIYALAIIATALYFVPGLIAFAESNNSAFTTAYWYERGQTWQRWSWVRGTFLYVGFTMLLIALTKNK
jgi:phosphoglycerol transferase MdoB-like AlkP superfamily enzyme